jgi:predicted dehydrogenase
MGLGRGLDHVRALQKLQDVEIRYLVDVDEARLKRAVQSCFASAGRVPQLLADFRRALEDRELDALFVATPNHWHAPATLLACEAGKHVYVEKPGSHNAAEAVAMSGAAGRYRRRIQLGTQRRSWPALIEAVARLRAGEIGEVRSARAWYTNSRATIGRGRATMVPAGLDYDLWQGPAPERPFVDNVVHYNWHWRWHWGGGEVANNGPHAFDLARWGLGAGLPRRVTCGGGRHHFQDDQETPDTVLATLDFGKASFIWDGSSCHPRRHESLPFVTWYGEKGSLSNHGTGYRILDPDGKETARGDGPGGDLRHIANFIEAIRENEPLNAPIGEGQDSVLPCHLANVAYRTGGELEFDPATRKILHNREAARLWGREYRRGWKPRL